MLKLTTLCLGAMMLASATGAHAVDLQLDAALPPAAEASAPAVAFDLTFLGTPETIDLEQAYTAAISFQKNARRQHLRLLVQLQQQQQAAEALALANKSLVEREEEKLDLDSAMPEASPAPNPFSSSRPEPIVSNASSLPDFTTPLEMSNLAATPEPPTWALFGLGAAMLIFVVPACGKKNNPKNK